MRTLRLALKNNLQRFHDRLAGSVAERSTFFSFCRFDKPHGLCVCNGIEEEEGDLRGYPGNFWGRRCAAPCLPVCPRALQRLGLVLHVFCKNHKPLTYDSLSSKNDLRTFDSFRSNFFIGLTAPVIDSCNRGTATIFLYSFLWDHVDHVEHVVVVLSVKLCVKRAEFKSAP